MTTAGRPEPAPAADYFTNVLDAEAQAREAIQQCQAQHDETLCRAQAQAVRIRRRASARVEKIQAAAAARIQALAQGPGPSAPTAGKRLAAEDAALLAGVERLAVQLTGGKE